MFLKLIRDKFTDVSTTGKLYIDGVFFGYVLEDVVRKPGIKVPGRTAIPYGTYPLTFEKSPRLSRQKGYDFLTPRLHNVPGFEGVLIHVGNYDRDTDGCLLPGLTRTIDMVGSSQKACDKLYPLMTVRVHARGLPNRNHPRLTMNFIDKLFNTAPGMVAMWALIVFAGWFGGFLLSYFGLPGATACLVVGTLLGVGGGIYAFVRSNKKS